VILRKNQKKWIINFNERAGSTTTPTAIIDEFKNLVSFSITNPEVGNTKFEDLHRSIIKRSFDARNIKIDLKLPMSNSKNTNISNITFE